MASPAYPSQPIPDDEPGTTVQLNELQWAYVDSKSNPRAPDWVLFALDCPVPSQKNLAQHFIYAKRVSCGHYVRGYISDETIRNVLSPEQIQESTKFLDPIEGNGRAPGRKGTSAAQSQPATELSMPLVLHMHLNRVQVCRVFMPDDEPDFASCIEQQTRMRQAAASEKQFRPGTITDVTASRDSAEGRPMEPHFWRRLKRSK